MGLGFKWMVPKGPFASVAYTEASKVFPCLYLPIVSIVAPFFG